MTALTRGGLNLLVSVALIAVTACAGGGGGHNGGGGGGGGVGGVGGTVTIIQPGAGTYPQVVASTQLSFAAKVASSNGSPISWGVQGGDTCTATNGVSSLGTPGGTMSVGTIPTSSSDKAVISYTAPATPPPGMLGAVTVTALQSPSTTGPCVVIYVVATNNNLLNFTYVFGLNGFSTASGLPFAVIGRLKFDGNGHVVNGLEDVNIAQADGSSAAYTTVAFSGTYNLDSSSHGTMTLTVTSPPWTMSPPLNPPPTTMKFTLTLSLDGSFGGLIETDGAAAPPYVGSGFYQVQGSSTKFTTQYIAGPYAMIFSGTAGAAASAVAKGLVGRLDLTASTATAGTIGGQSDDQSGSATSPLTGTYTIDDQTNGHGTFSITGGANPTLSFYIAGPGLLFALRTDKNVLSSTEGILSGVVRTIPAPATFDNTSLQSGLFELQGIKGGHASAALGFYASGQQVGSTTNGFLTGIVDLNDGGAVPSTPPVSFAGPNGPNPVSFTIATNGRGTITFVLNGVTYNFVFYMRKAGVAFVLEQPASDLSNRGRAGRFFPQLVMNPAGGTYIGSTAVTTAGSENALAVLPIVIANKAATFQNGQSDTSVLGTAAMSGAVSGTFTVTDQTTNRGTLAMSAGRMAGSGTAAFYISADTEVIVLGTDPTNMDPQLVTFDQ